MKRGRVPLVRALSKLGLATRTEAQAMIEAGRISLDGQIVRDPLLAIVPEHARITIDAREVQQPAPVTILLHKPRGVVTTRRDPQGRRTVYDLLGDLDEHVIPVGRLDFATSGLLLLTNDTRLADWLTDPANEVVRVYLVTVRGRVTPDLTTSLERGLMVNGERLAAQHALLRKASGRESLLVVNLVEGKNREIRRMMQAVGHPVTRLRRVQFGGLTLDDLPVGRWRRLSRRELARAFPGAPLSALRPRSSSR